MTGTRLNDCTPTPDEQAKYDTEIKDEAQIRECMARDVFLAVDQRTLLRLLDEARAEIARLRTLRDEWEGRWLALKTERHGERDREGAMRAAIRNYNDADEEIIRAKREARAAALEEAAQVADKLAPLRSIYKNVGASIRALAAAPPQSERPPQTITPWHDSTVPPLAPLPSQE
jgi:predicted  nucleic acid-binding Zn-ribbon protein